MDLNADLGEGCPWDVALLACVTSASVCCGAHAGDPDAIRATLAAAQARGVVVGAHPGYPDRSGFGRRARAITAREVEALLIDQVAALRGLADPLSVAIRFLKPHGALYNQAQEEAEVAAGVVAAARALGLPVLGMPDAAVAGEASRRGVRFVAEGFADRAYTAGGRLRPRTEPGAVLTDPGAIAGQVARLAGAGIETLCLHGDTPGAVALAGMVREALRQHSVPIAPFLPVEKAADEWAGPS